MSKRARKASKETTTKRPRKEETSDAPKKPQTAIIFPPVVVLQYFKQKTLQQIAAASKEFASVDINQFDLA